MNPVHQYDELSEKYILGELSGDVVENEETANLSGELDKLIMANAPADVADKLIELLSAYSAACQRDGFVGGLRFGIRVGLTAAKRAV